MTDPQSDESGRILRFRHRRSDELVAPDDLSRYHASEEPDDYRHRMLVNLAAFAVVAALIAAGLWIANTMAAMRENQDCVLSGRRGCTPVEVQRERW